MESFPMALSTENDLHSNNSTGNSDAQSHAQSEDSDGLALLRRARAKLTHSSCVGTQAVESMLPNQETGNDYNAQAATDTIMPLIDPTDFLESQLRRARGNLSGCALSGTVTDFLAFDNIVQSETTQNHWQTREDFSIQENHAENSAVEAKFEQQDQLADQLRRARARLSRWSCVNEGGARPGAQSTANAAGEESHRTAGLECSLNEPMQAGQDAVPESLPGPKQVEQAATPALPHPGPTQVLQESVPEVYHHGDDMEIESESGSPWSSKEEKTPEESTSHTFESQKDFNSVQSDLNIQSHLDFSIDVGKSFLVNSELIKIPGTDPGNSLTTDPSVFDEMDIEPATATTEMQENWCGGELEKSPKSKTSSENHSRFGIEDKHVKQSHLFKGNARSQPTIVKQDSSLPGKEMEVDSDWLENKTEDKSSRKETRKVQVDQRSSEDSLDFSLSPFPTSDATPEPQHKEDSAATDFRGFSCSPVPPTLAAVASILANISFPPTPVPPPQAAIPQPVPPPRITLPAVPTPVPPPTVALAPSKTVPLLATRTAIPSPAPCPRPSNFDSLDSAANLLALSLSSILPLLSGKPLPVPPPVVNNSATPTPVPPPIVSKSTKPSPVPPPIVSKSVKLSPVPPPAVSKSTGPSPVPPPVVSKSTRPSPVPPPVVSKSTRPSPVPPPVVSKSTRPSPVPPPVVSKSTRPSLLPLPTASRSKPSKESSRCPPVPPAASKPAKPSKPSKPAAAEAAPAVAGSEEDTLASPNQMDFLFSLIPPPPPASSVDLDAFDGDGEEGGGKPPVDFPLTGLLPPGAGQAGQVDFSFTRLPPPGHPGPTPDFSFTRFLPPPRPHAPPPGAVWFPGRPPHPTSGRTLLPTPGGPGVRPPLLPTPPPTSSSPSSSSSSSSSSSASGKTPFRSGRSRWGVWEESPAPAGAQPTTTTPAPSPSNPTTATPNSSNPTASQPRHPDKAQHRLGDGRDGKAAAFKSERRKVLQPEPVARIHSDSDSDSSMGAFDSAMPDAGDYQSDEEMETEDTSLRTDSAVQGPKSRPEAAQAECSVNDKAVVKPKTSTKPGPALALPVKVKLESHQSKDGSGRVTPMFKAMSPEVAVKLASNTNANVETSQTEQTDRKELLKIQTDRRHKIQHKERHGDPQKERKEKGKPFRCTECGHCFNERFHLEAHLYDHLAEVTGKHPYRCSKCPGRVFQDMKLHQHHHMMGLECDVCGEAFHAAISLAEHRMRVHMAKKSHCCHICKKRYATSGDLAHHQKKRHLKTKPYRCKKCGKGFHHKDSLSTHMKNHSGEQSGTSEPRNASAEKDKDSKRNPTESKSHSSSPSKEGLATKDQSNEHIDSASEMDEDKLLSCEFCDGTFTNLEDLKSHETSHGDKPYRCDDCGENFSQKQEFKDHCKKHKTHKCLVCACIYSSSSSLLKHMQNLHEDDVFECTHCDKWFSKKDELLSHVDAEHGTGQVEELPESSDVVINQEQAENT